MQLAILHLRDERPEHPDFQGTLDALNDATLRTAAALGWSTEIIAGDTAPIRATLDAVRRADAVVVMGGEDVTPSLYDGPSEYPGSGRHAPHADTAHLAAVHTAIAHRTPLLGICRGAQLINVALGGTLIQDLGPDNAHRGGTVGLDNFRPVALALSPGSDLARDVDPGEPVYCGHHQAVDALGIDLRVVARSADGGIEAIVHEFAPVTGVQWHPEHPRTAETQLTRLFQRLARQAGVSAAA